MHIPMRVARRALVAFVVALPFLGGAAQAQRGGRGGGGGPAVNVSSNPLLSSFRFRNVGPASMGGRIDDIEVSVTNPNVIYLGYAVSGVWKSDNNAVTFSPVFDEQGAGSIGDIAI